MQHNIDFFISLSRLRSSIQYRRYPGDLKMPTSDLFGGKKCPLATAVRMTIDEMSLDGRSAVTVCCKINFTGGTARSRYRSFLGDLSCSVAVSDQSRTRRRESHNRRRSSARRRVAPAHDHRLVALPFATDHTVLVIYCRETHW